ncbi:MAG: hypothetical protein RLZZ360_381 [Candidatus Parcubacteria bacterium]|jgi:alkylated DNA nucleotide flippase Atl1
MERIGTVEAVFLRKAHGRAVEESTVLNLVADFGIVGDINFSASSPRHLLLKRIGRPGDWTDNAGYFNENVSFTSESLNSLRPGDIVRVGSATLLVRSKNERCNIFAPEVRVARGLHCVCIDAGSIRRSDDIIKLGSVSIAEDSRAALLVTGLRAVPLGRVVTFEDACTMIGGSRPHLRIIPRLLKIAITLHPTGVPFHRLVKSKGDLIDNIVTDQMLLLAAEGISTSNGRTVNLQFRHVFGRNPFCEM